MISVDTKKKELIGNYKNAGREYHQKGQSPKVNVYDFLDKEKGKVAPYGVYDLDKNKGWVSVGISSDTAQFAVNSIRSWWSEIGQETYQNATRLYINADGGGSNGSRNRLWKRELQQFANETNIANTTTKTGLKIQARLDERHYQTGIKVSDREMKLLNLHQHTFHGEWNYLIQPN